MNIIVMDGLFTLCKVSNMKQINFDEEFCFIAKTHNEISLVCSKKNTPKTAIEREDDLRLFRIEKVEFSDLNIISDIANILDEQKISVLTIATFETEYFLLKETSFNDAMLALEKHGYKR